MTTLHDRLADLAADAPPGGPAPGLWDQGTRYHRRRRTGTLAIAAAACLALLVITGLSWQRSEGLPEPAAPPSTTGALPDRLWTPSPWLPGTDEAGPLGALAVVMGADRGSWRGSTPGLVGVSAATGEYRFLDLPDRAVGDVALSPDGRKVAYWLTGPTSGSPHPSEAGPVAGVAVYDATTGDVRRADIQTEHGLEPDALVWADPGDLVLSYGQQRGGAGDDSNTLAQSTSPEAFRWRLDHDAPDPLGVPKGAQDATVVGASDGRVALSDSRRYWCYYLDEPGFAYPALDDAHLEMSTQPAFESTFRFAFVRGPMNPGSVVVGEATGSDGGARSHVVPDSGGTYDVLGWSGADRVVVERGTGRDHVGAAVFAVDVETGESDELVRLPGAADVRNVQLASDLWTTPTVAGRQPPRPLDPRTVAGLVGATGLAGVLGVVLWRRRVRP